MSGFETDKVFDDSLPKVYETYLVPLIFSRLGPHREETNEKVIS